MEFYSEVLNTLENPVELNWNLREDFDALAMMGPRIFRGVVDGSTKFLIMWDMPMLENKDFYESVKLIKDYGEGKRKVGLALLSLEKKESFEDRHKIRIFH